MPELADKGLVMHQIKSDVNIFQKLFIRYPQILFIFIYDLLQFLIEKINTGIKSARNEKNLLFGKERFEDILTNLERWYDLDIIQEDKKPGECEIKATFREKGFEYDLHALKLTGPFWISLIKSKHITVEMIK